MGGGHGLMNYEAIGAAASLKWWFNFSEIGGLSSTVTKHDTTYCSTASNKAAASTGDSGDFQNVAGGGATSTSPNFVSDGIKAGRSNLDFVGDENHLDISDAGGAELSDFQIYVVMKVTDEDGQTVNYFAGHTAEDLIAYYANINQWAYIWNGGTTTLMGGPALSDGLVSVFCFGGVSGTAAQVTLAAAGTGVGASATKTANLSGDFNMRAIGSIIGGGTSATPHMHVGEVLIFNERHTNDQLRQIIKELKKEWAITY